MNLSDISLEKRMKIIKTLDVNSYLDELEKIAEPGAFLPNEDQALMVLHKARYFLSRQGHLEKKYMKDSRRWLMSNGFKLPNV